DPVWVRSEILDLDRPCSGLLVLLHLNFTGSDECTASPPPAGVKNDFHEAERVIPNSATAANFRKTRPTFEGCHKARTSIIHLCPANNDQGPPNRARGRQPA